MNPIYMFALVALLGFQTGCIAMWRYYRRQIDQLERDLQWERNKRAQLDSNVRAVEPRR